MKKSEKEKMLSGELYDASCPVLVNERKRSRKLCRDLADADESEKAYLLKQLFGEETNVTIEPPFFCDYGTNIELGENVYFNYNCVVLDVMNVSIGDNTLIGPAVQIYTATHPLDANTRRSGLESGKPVVIGADVWIGGGAVICPGVTIGDRSIIGAGSVVTRNVSSDTVVGGNPANTIRTLSN